MMNLPKCILTVKICLLMFQRYLKEKNCGLGVKETSLRILLNKMNSEKLTKMNTNLRIGICGRTALIQDFWCLNQVNPKYFVKSYVKKNLLFKTNKLFQSLKIRLMMTMMRLLFSTFTNSTNGNGG